MKDDLLGTVKDYFDSDEAERTRSGKNMKAPSNDRVGRWLMSSWSKTVDSSLIQRSFKSTLTGNDEDLNYECFEGDLNESDDDSDNDDDDYNDSFVEESEDDA
jgi:hypothetical protein